MGMLNSYGQGANAFAENFMRAYQLANQTRMDRERLGMQREEYDRIKANREGIKKLFAESQIPAQSAQDMAFNPDAVSYQDRALPGDMEGYGGPQKVATLTPQGEGMMTGGMDFNKFRSGVFPFIDEHSKPLVDYITDTEKLPMLQQKAMIDAMVAGATINDKNARAEKNRRDPTGKALHFIQETKYDPKTKLTFSRTIGLDPITGEKKSVGEWGNDPSKGREQDINITQQSQFVDPQTGNPLIFDKKTNTYKVAPIEGNGGAAPRPINPSAGEREKTAALDSLMEQLKVVEDTYKTNPDYVGLVSGQVGRLTQLTDKNEAAFRQKVLDIKDSLLRARSGAQINEQEYARLAKLVPDMGDSAAQFEGKMASFKQSLLTLQQERTTAQGRGGVFQGRGQSPPPKNAEVPTAKVPTPQAITRLKQNPKEAALFDMTFGVGASKKYLGGK